MKQVINSVFFISMIICSSCGGGTASEKAEQNPQNPALTNSATDSSSVSAVTKNVNPTTNPTPNPAATQANTVTTISADSVNAMLAKGLNPPHGAPGHRCDIAVGQPLGSKPPPIPTGPAVTPDSVKAMLAKGLNPPHGQPGHRCDIDVGAPLNSKPKVILDPATQATPAKTDSSKTDGQVKKDSSGITPGL